MFDMVPALWAHVDYEDVARFCSSAGRHAAALDACEIGLRLRGPDAALLVRRAQAHDGLGDYAAAIADCEAALALDPEPRVAVNAWVTLAYAHESDGQMMDACEAALRGIAIAPNRIEGHCAYGNVLARAGDLAPAWPQLECHWLAERIRYQQRFGGPEWNGEDLAGKRVVVVHAQGLGDMLQMARYLPRLRERAAHVTLECPPSLAPLLRAVPGVDVIAAPDTIAPAQTDAFARLMTLPRIFAESGSRGANAPYLRVPPEALSRWARLVPRERRLRVGFAWAGNPFHTRDRARSIPLALCAAWADIPDIAWTSLQIGPSANDAADAALPLARYDVAITDMSDTAALIAQLDLVIAVDTAVAHLAGALGKPVWLLLPQRADWRWPRTAETTHWYASMRIVHAAQPGWAGLIDDVALRLRKHTRDRNESLPIE
jgi:hypothetical protein